MNGSLDKWFLELESRWYVLISVAKYLCGKYTKTNYKKIKYLICILPNPTLASPVETSNHFEIVMVAHEEQKRNKIAVCLMLA